MEFLKTHKVALTPLSPIHIGCGEDFEPTNYVIDAEQKLLYGFDPSRAVLSEELTKELASLGESADLLGIQDFFNKHRDKFIPHAKVKIPVAGGIVRHYHENIGMVANHEDNGNDVFNRFTIARHVHSKNIAFIPGSSLKGALRTAILDSLNEGNGVSREEKEDGVKLAKRLLGGDFETSPLRLFKPSDLMPLDGSMREILYAVNCYKQPKQDLKNKKLKFRTGISARYECLLSAQYRAFVGEVTVGAIRFPGKEDVVTLQDIAKRCNNYYLPRLQEELKEKSDHGFLHPKWKLAIEKILEEMSDLFQNGRAMLLCLGRFGGAENKTLSCVAEINIPQKHTTLPKSTTHWLAASFSESEKGLLPFGWVVVEIDPQEPLSKFKAWCDVKTSDSMDMLSRYNAMLIDEPQPSIEPDSPQAIIDKYKCDMGKRVESLRGKKEKPNGADHQKASALAKQAHEDEIWTADDKKAAAAAIEEWLPKVVAIEMKDVRKKLKLSELKGNVA